MRLRAAYGFLLAFATAAAACAQPAPPARTAGPAPDRGVEMMFWDSIKNDRDPAAYEEYLRKWPDGSFASLARLRIRAAREGVAAAPPPAVGLPSASAPSAPQAAAGPGSGSSEAPVSIARLPPPDAAAPAGASSTDAETLPTGDSAALYNTGFGRLRAGDLAGAETAFRELLRRYPQDGLAGNARYWLGETYFVRGDNDRAAIAFADVYKNDPAGSRAPDALYKLGTALERAGRSADACEAFGELRRAYPLAADRFGVTQKGPC